MEFNKIISNNVLGIDLILKHKVLPLLNDYCGEKCSYNHENENTVTVTVPFPKECNRMFGKFFLNPVYDSHFGKMFLHIDLTEWNVRYVDFDHEYVSHWSCILQKLVDVRELLFNSVGMTFDNTSKTYLCGVADEFDYKPLLNVYNTFPDSGYKFIVFDFVRAYEKSDINTMPGVFVFLNNGENLIHCENKTLVRNSKTPEDIYQMIAHSSNINDFFMFPHETYEEFSEHLKQRYDVKKLSLYTW